MRSHFSLSSNQSPQAKDDKGLEAELSAALLRPGPVLRRSISTTGLAGKGAARRGGGQGAVL
jgi:hypothetical protein